MSRIVELVTVTLLSLPKDGDIVFARTGATTGKSYLLKDPPLSVFASYLIRLQVIDKINHFPTFISLYFQTKGYWDRIKVGISGSTQGGFNASKLSELVIATPSIKLQHEIVDKALKLLTDINKLEELYKIKLEKLDELNHSILQAAFSGNLIK